MQDAPVKPLARLREDVVLHRGRRRGGGAPTIVLHDPASNAHFELGWLEYELITRWGLGTEAAIVAAVRSETTLVPRPEDVQALARFLTANGLVRVTAKEILAAMAGAAHPGMGRRLARLLSSVLFRRLPLVAPQAMLVRGLWLARPFFTRAFLVLMVLLLGVALHLVSLEWSAFRAGLAAIASPEAIAGILAALAIGKSLHELAHAFATVRHGGEVTSMGVSLIMLWPVLYTETSSAWTLPDRSKRMEIAAAGVLAEGCLAIVALLAWPLIDPGPMRNAVQFAAGTLVLMSLVVNLNPLMRFDGYFLLSEALAFDNLHPRAVAMLQSCARLVFAGHRAPSPEPELRLPQRGALALFGAAVLVYRITLYAGITLMISRVLAPAFALPLAGAVIAAFLIAPLAAEMASWLKLAQAAKGRLLGASRVALMLAPIVLVIILPWRSSVTMPAIYEGGRILDVYAPEPALVKTVLGRLGDQVATGTSLLRLAAPDVEQRLDALRQRANALERTIELKRGRSDFHEALAVGEAELLRIGVEVQGLMSRLARLDLRSPSPGVIELLATGLAAGRWVSREEPLVRIVAARETTATGFADERDIGLIRPGARAALLLDGLPDRVIGAVVESVFQEGLTELDNPLLASINGGPVIVRQGAANALLPESALYKVRLALVAADGHELPMIETRGFARIETEPRSLANRLIERLIGLWRREVG